MEVGALLFSFRGRLNRANYWLAQLIYVCTNLILVLLRLVMLPGLTYQALSMVVNFGIFVSGLAVATKRLHDRDKSAWWLLPYYVLPVLMVIAVVAYLNSSEEPPDFIDYLLLGPLAIWVWVVVDLGCLRGTVGPNKYGLDPLGIR